MNMRDNGINVIVGQREGTKNWDKAVADGWVQARRYSMLKKPQKKELLFNICFRMQVSVHSGRRSLNV